MLSRISYVAIGLIFLFPCWTPCFAQDAVKVAPDHYKILKENKYVRVIENTLEPGAKDGLHVHPDGWY
jgi:hypothetical protein